MKPSIFRPILFALLVLLTSLSISKARIGSEKPQEEKVKAPPARENPILREYFRHRFLGLMEGPFSGAPKAVRAPDPFFIERQIDHQIDRLLEDIEHRLKLMESLIGSISQKRELLFSQNQEPASRHALSQEWKDELKEFREQAANLRSLLRGIFPELEDSDRFKPEFQRGAQTDRRFEIEVQFLQEEFNRASNEIKDYLFLPTHTITVANLKGQNLLIHLYHIEKMADEIRNEL